MSSDGSSILNNAKDTFTSLGNNLSNTALSSWEAIKKATGQTPQAAGRKRKRRRSMKMKGGYHAYSPSHGVGLNASRITGIHTARFHNVGGKRRKSKKHRHTSKCRKH